MKKLICLVIALCLCIFAFTACSGNFTGVSNYGGEVSSNGGFAVQKGDYVYFINGKGYYTDDNTFGSVVKGALVRAKLADIQNYGTETACEVVVPKLFYTQYDYAKSGFYIFGDYVYYTTPSTDKDKTGTVQNSIVNFTRTKLDGTDTSVIASVDGLSTPYIYAAEGNDVYLTVYKSETDDGNSVYYLYTYSVDGKEVRKSQAVSSYVFPEDGAYAYYKKSAHNEDLDEDEDFDEIYRYSLTGKEEVKVLSGAGMYTDEHGTGTQGVTFSFIKLTNDTLYLSETYVDTSVSTITRYYGVKLADFTADTTANKAKLVLLNKGTTDAANIFTDSSVYYAMDKIIYNDSTYGLVRYDYTKQDDIKSFGIEQLIYSSDIMSYTYCYDDGEYMYYYGSTYYYRIKIEDVLAKNEDVHQITYTTTSGTDDFYKFEIFGDTIMILNAYDPFYDYVCAYDMTTVDKLTAEDGKTMEETVNDFCEEFATADRAHVLKRLNYRVAVVSDTDKEALETYMDGSYPEDSSSS